MQIPGIPVIMMHDIKQCIPVIDLFAGPGGLSEGFSSFSEFLNNSTEYQVKLSIEKDEIAANTLRLRSFFRKFSEGNVPQCYYDFIRGDESALELMQSLPEWKSAKDHVWNGALGEIDENDLHKRIRSALCDNKNWVLLGGPPCQAYSLIGRARMSGIGHELRNASLKKDELEKLRDNKESVFLRDHRQTLYLEYLRIVAVHQPAVFVMENVKGILSAKLPDGETETGKPKFKKAFNQIRSDLENPWEALRSDGQYQLLKSFHEGEESEYVLHSFVSQPKGDLLNEYEDKDFLIRSEEYGIPQKRHRVIILGIRKDLATPPNKLIATPQVNVRDVLDNMPLIRSGLSKDTDTLENWQKVMTDTLPKPVRKKLPENCRTIIANVLKHNITNLNRGGAFIETDSSISEKHPKLSRWLEDAKLKGVIQHDTRAHMNSDIGRYLFVSAMGEATSQSPRLDEWPVELLPAHKNVFDGDRSKIKDFKDRFKVQLYDQPASTVTAHISKDGHYFIHPDPNQCRSLTMREAARIQTFPDNYYFWGNRTQRYQQVGNAVPPFLAVQLAQIVTDILASNND